MQSRTIVARSATLGALADLRAFATPAILSRAAHRNLIPIRRSPTRLLRTSTARNLLALLALGELVGDKLPFTPRRLEWAALAFRAASGAICGSVISWSGSRGRREAKPAALGAVVGGLAALAGAFAGFHLRQATAQRWGGSDPAIAVVEDMVAIAGSIAIMARQIVARQITPGHTNRWTIATAGAL
jgi:uncharacterized membrane protein